MLDRGDSEASCAQPIPAQTNNKGCFFRVAAITRAATKKAFAEVLVRAQSLDSGGAESPRDSKGYSSSLKVRARQAEVFFFDPFLDTAARFSAKTAA